MERADQVIKDAWGAISWAAKVDTERAELAALQQQSREAKPLDVQLRGALQHRVRCERLQEQAAEAVEQTLREQAELATKLAAFKLASREATTNLATAEEECKRLQEWHAQRVLGPDDLPRAPNVNSGIIRVGPVAVTAEEAVEVQAVLDGMLGRIPPQLHTAFVFAINQSFAMPPYALPPAPSDGGGEAEAAAGTAEPVDTAACLQQRKSIEAASSRASGRFAPA